MRRGCGGDDIDSWGYDDPDAGREDPRGSDLDSGEEDDWAWWL